MIQNSEFRKKQKEKEKKRTEEIATPEMFYRKEEKLVKEEGVLALESS